MSFNLTTEQYFKAIAIIPKPASILSMSGSLYIIYHVVTDPSKRSKCQFRLLTGLGVFDVLTSTATFMSTWPIPPEIAGPVWGAAGNTATCRVHGFFMQLSVGGSSYNAALALYYLLAVRYGWKETQFVKIERYLHGIPIIWGIGTATVGLLLNSYHNATLWCWFAPPFKYYNEFRLGLFYSVVWFTMSMSLYSMTMISYTVWKQESINARYMQRSFRKTKMVATQGFFYCFMYLMTWVVPSAFRLMQHRNQPTNYVLLCFMSYFVAGQGFANFLVFIRPRILQRIREYSRSTRNATISAGSGSAGSRQQQQQRSLGSAGGSGTGRGESGRGGGSDHSNENVGEDRIYSDCQQLPPLERPIENKNDSGDGNSGNHQQPEEPRHQEQGQRRHVRASKTVHYQLDQYPREEEEDDEA